MTEQSKDIQLLRNAENIQFVKEMLALLISNDLPLALEKMTEDIDWQSPVTNTVTDPISWSRPRHSRFEVQAFFDELFSKIRGFEMEFLSYTAQEDRVIVEGTTHGVVESTGRDYTTSWIMIFTIRNGKVLRFRHYYDTADMARAFESKKRSRKAA